ncbi:MAG TPA: nuclear transport factor 2 family protein [Flavisolibacter sp.]|nr:nuclear transport factor 2 family protein [Flavisolibacter sp.]
MKEREAIIQNYIAGYNEFDIDKMVQDFDDEIVFQNISGGETTLSLLGLNALKVQAQQATQYFSSRTQTIKSFTHKSDDTEIEVDYNATLAIDLPDGLKKGEELHLQGRSIFTFSGNKITKLVDIS